MNEFRRLLLPITVALASACLGGARSSRAALQFYYDPATGNVSFDTTHTRSGMVQGYSLNLGAKGTTPFLFRTENMIRLSNSTLYTDWPNSISDSTQSSLWQGLYTIGDILPSGLSEKFWQTFFTPLIYNPPNLGSHSYVDVVGGGFPPPAEFIYGAPNGEFVNAIDLIDPDTLTWAENAKLVYYAATGEVVIDTSGPESGYITLLTLKSANRFHPEGFNPSIETGPFTMADPDTIFLAVDLIEPGLLSLGKILPAGLSSLELAHAVTSAKYLGRAGFDLQSFDFEAHGQNLEFAFVAVPEPSSMVIAGTTALLLFRRRESLGTAAHS